jgi:hypothetical protein
MNALDGLLAELQFQELERWSALPPAPTDPLNHGARSPASRGRAAERPAALAVTFRGAVARFLVRTGVWLDRRAGEGALGDLPKYGEGGLR